jgi:DNA polymerase-3 subunit epsilon
MRWWRRRRQPWYDATYWAVDLETTGLDPRRDRILSVGMVPVRDGVVRWGERLYTLVRGAESTSGSGALAVHQILPGDSSLSPDEAEVVRQVIQRLDGRVLLAHHASVELGFLKSAARRHRCRWPSPRVVDTVHLLHLLDQRMERLQPYPPAVPKSLDGARERLGLPKHRAHHALADALATAELFLALRARLEVRTLGQLL